jgi:hypothetical protein
MAIGAPNLRSRVRTRERKIRPLVIKRFIIQYHYLGLASLVFRMAITASVVSYTPVISGLVLYILSNVFMIVTTQTKLVLSATFERLVTSFTLVFKLGMTLNQVTRGNHRVERAHVRF